MFNILRCVLVCFQISTSTEMQYDDAFTLQQVAEDHVWNLNFMAGMVPFIQKLIKDVSYKLNTQRETHQRYEL